MIMVNMFVFGFGFTNKFVLVFHFHIREYCPMSYVIVKKTIGMNWKLIIPMTFMALRPKVYQPLTCL